MTPTERTGDRRVELFVRDGLPEPAARQCERLTNRLTALEADDTVAAVATFTWDKRVQCGDPVKTKARDRYEEFEAWAADRGVSLRPFFGTRECYSMETGERGEWIVYPALCLAVYDDGDLASVFPHADGDDYRSVTDGLDALGGESTETASDSDATDDREPVVVGNAD